ncbi:hypothetical protein B0H14DRAFT_3889495, partial [Mycena olivaceomarginata]
MSLAKRPPASLQSDMDMDDALDRRYNYDNDEDIDPELRLRTVRTAHSAIAENAAEKTVLGRTEREDTAWAPPRGGGPRQGQAGGRGRPEGKRRNVYVNTPLPRGELDSSGDPLVRYPRNKVRTTKYTILTFIPRNLWEQFRRIANLFFLTLVVLQQFSVFGATSGAISALPLAFILVASAIKDGIEDHRRGQLDEEVNTSPTTRLAVRNPNIPKDPRSLFEKLLGLNRPGAVSRGVRRLRAAEARAPPGSQSTLNVDDSDGRSIDGRSVASTAHSYPPAAVLDPNFRAGAAQWERTLWKKLEVGDIVLLRDNEQVPADIVVLATSDPDGNCYLETKNLDGETNLKLRKSLVATRNMSSAEEEVQRARFVLDSEAPSQNLYLYHGVLRYRDFSSASAFSSVHARATNNNINYDADFHGQGGRGG